MYSLPKVLWLELCLCWGLSWAAMGAPVIIGVDSASLAEKTAFSELEEGIRKVCGDDDAGLPAIKLVYSEFLGPEEWLIRRKDGGELIIVGGRPRGVLYGVYEFCERVLGVTFCALNYTDYPGQKNIILPVDLEWHGKPAFVSRDCYSLTRNMPLSDFFRYHVRLRMNSSGNRPELGFSERPGLPSGAHSYLHYTRDFPAEIGWMNPTGERIQVTTTTAGQICYTHPEVRRRFSAKLREYITADRDACAKSGAPYPVVYDISANDCNAACHCPECKAFAAKHNVSGLVLDFTNAIALDIVKDYPEIKIMCFAYKDTMVPPTNGIKAADNVIVRLAIMDVEFGAGNHTRDVLRPLGDKQNQWYREMLSAWGAQTSNLAIWDYWKLYYDAFPSPKGFISSRADYIRAYQQVDATQVFIEAEIDAVTQLESFADLRIYIAARLMVTPDLDLEAELSRYFKAFYGAGAPAMREYLTWIEEQTALEPRPLGYVHVTQRQYMTREFLAQCDALLVRAAAAVAGDPSRLAHVNQERLIVDLAMANCFPPVTQELKQRIAQNYQIWGRKYYSTEYWDKEGTALTEGQLARLAQPVLPAEFAALNGIKDLWWGEFNPGCIGPDADAAGGKAMLLSKALSYCASKESVHGPNLMFGIYDRNLKRYLTENREISKADLPQDQKFHWYRVGRVRLTENASLWGHWSWYLGLSLRGIYDKAMPDREYEIVVSLKVTGPSYVFGSTLPDDIMLDRVIAVPADVGLPEGLKVY